MFIILLYSRTHLIRPGFASSGFPSPLNDLLSRVRCVGYWQKRCLQLYLFSVCDAPCISITLIILMQQACVASAERVMDVSLEWCAGTMLTELNREQEPHQWAIHARDSDECWEGNIIKDCMKIAPRPGRIFEAHEVLFFIADVHQTQDWFRVVSNLSF